MMRIVKSAGDSREPSWVSTQACPSPHRDVTLPPAMWSTVATGHDIAEAYNYLITYFLTATYLLYFQCCGGGAKNLPHDSWAP